MIESLIEVFLKEDEDFLKVKETLTRIGIANRQNNTLFQSCHILHKRGKYYVLHFKQLFMLDGKKADFTEDDEGRLNTIVTLLSEWGLVEIVNPEIIDYKAPLSQIKVLPYIEKENWDLVPKYNIGKRD